MPTTRARASAAYARAACAPALAFALAAGCASATGRPAAPEESEPGEPWARGSLDSRYRGRFGSGTSDHDLRETLSLELGHAGRDRFTGALLAEAQIDLDGEESPDSPFHALDDTRDGDVEGRLYEAWIGAHEWSDLPMARLGRQLVYDTPITLWFDGGRFETRELGGARVRLGVHGGVPVRVDEPAQSGDVIAGAFVAARPGKSTRLRADWLHVEDEERFGEHRDDLAALSVEQTCGERLRLDASGSLLDGEPRDALGRVTWFDADSDLMLQASWFELLEEQNDLALELDPFTSVLLAQFPYSQARLMASQGFGGGWSAEAGFDVRRVHEEGDVSPFNRDFERAFATIGAEDLLPAGIAIAVTGEVWDADGSDIETFGLDLERAMSSTLTASVGTYYSLYKTDLELGEEREDVRTYYVRARWRQSDVLTFHARIEHEDGPAEYGTIRLGATWRF